MKRMYRLRQYRDRSGFWRWTLYAANGKKVACAGEGYRRRIDCHRIASQLFPGLFALPPTHHGTL